MGSDVLKDIFGVAPEKWGSFRFSLQVILNRLLL